MGRADAFMHESATVPVHVDESIYRYKLSAGK